MDPTIADLLRNRKAPLLSFEFFPPKDDAGLDALRRAAEALLAAAPDFVTVTYGAGGSKRNRTLEICDMLRELGYMSIMPHLTCVGMSRQSLIAVIEDIHARGYRNIMALRGDPPRGQTHFVPVPDGLEHAIDLVRLIKNRHPDICCGVAGYPETHPEAPSPEDDVRRLKEKLQAGASFVTTQLFFDNRLYFDFVRRCRAQGIEEPIIPGLLPAISLSQARRMCERCRATLPEALVHRMEQAGAEGPAAEEVGIMWAVEQMEELLRFGAPAVHLYVLNRSKAALSPQMMDCFLRRRRH